MSGNFHCIPTLGPGESYQKFIEHHLMKNEPCILGEWATRSWSARDKWVREDGSPNFTHLCKEFGHAKVSVADCTKCHFSTHPKTDMTLAKYLEYWQSHDQYVVSPHGHTLCEETRNLLYLKDWHFIQQFPELKETSYSTHHFMSSDWLNEVWCARDDVMDDYRFVYMGPAGTWTPFHADVLRSHSWSANITGSKEWLLFPPKQEDRLRDRLGNLPFDVTSADIQEKIECGKAAVPIRVIQKTGEIMFVPSGWHHQVKNLEATISINHNWTNAFCLWNMWRHLQHELELVKRELQDCVGMDGWEQHCQVVLRASAGMDYWEFAQFIAMLALPRLHQFESLASLQCPVATMADSHVIDTLKEFIQQLRGSRSSALTFFRAGALPVDYGPPPDDLEKSLHPDEPFVRLLVLLPHQLREMVEMGRCKGQLKNNVLAFRSFELYVLSCVAEEVSKLLHTPPTLALTHSPSSIGILEPLKNLSTV